MSFDDIIRGRSLVARLTLWFAGVAAALVLATALLMYSAFLGGVRTNSDQLLQMRTLSIRALLTGPAVDPGELDREVRRQDFNAPRRIYVRVSGASIGTHETPNMPVFPAVAPDQRNAQEGRFGELDTERSHFRTLTLSMPLPARSGGDVATIEVAVDTGQDAAALAPRVWLAGLLATLALLVGCVAGWYAFRRQLLPLHSLAAAAASVEQSTLDRRVSLEHLPLELEEFAGQFNHMLGRLEVAYESLRRYADDVAHELRTPINRIQLGAEVALREAESLDTYREALESTLEECMHLGSMVKSLLFLARVENGQARLMAVPMNVAERLEKIRTFFEVNAAEGEIDFTLVCDERLSILADPTLFQRAVSNVVSNAFAHTPRGGRICIRAGAADSGAVIEVSDSGEGIAPEHQGRIFDRFYRGDGARVTSSGRVGLGLAITKSIVELHEGRVSLQSSPGAGTRVFLHFPANQAPADKA